MITNVVKLLKLHNTPKPKAQIPLQDMKPEQRGSNKHEEMLRHRKYSHSVKKNTGTSEEASNLPASTSSSSGGAEIREIIARSRKISKQERHVLQAPQITCEDLPILVPFHSYQPSPDGVEDNNDNKEDDDISVASSDLGIPDETHDFALPELRPTQKYRPKPLLQSKHPSLDPLFDSSSSSEDFRPTKARSLRKTKSRGNVREADKPRPSTSRAGACNAAFEAE